MRIEHLEQSQEHTVHKELLELGLEDEKKKAEEGKEDLGINNCEVGGWSESLYLTVFLSCKEKVSLLMCCWP